jgi:hypothetical protein
MMRPLVFLFLYFWVQCKFFWKRKKGNRMNEWITKNDKKARQPHGIVTGYEKPGDV